MIQWMLAIWFLVPRPFLNPACTSGSSQFTYCWCLAWRILNITSLACEMSVLIWWFEHSLPLSFFEIGMKTHLFQSCGHYQVFHVCWHIECSTLTASSFRVLIAQLKFRHFHWLCSEWCFLRPTWLHSRGYTSVSTPYFL